VLGVDEGDSQSVGGGLTALNILYLCADWGIPVRGHKGASVHVREVVNTFDRLGHRVALAFANGGEGNPDPSAIMIDMTPDVSNHDRAREVELRGIELDPDDKPLRRELEKLAYDRRLATKLRSKLDAIGFAPDIVYERFSLFHEAGAALARALEVPHFLEVNARLLEEQESHRGLRLKSLAHAAQAQCFASASHIFTVSQSLKQYVEGEGVPDGRVTCLPNGVDTRRFAPGVDPNPTRARYGLGEHPVIGFVGSLKPWHGLDFLFDAMDALITLDETCRMVIVGDGPGSDYARFRAAEPHLESRIVLTGKVPYDEIPAHLAAMSLTVAPYVAQDGFYFSPLKVVESLAAGRPVVAPRIGQLSDLIEDGGTGLLYPPGDLAAFTACLHRLLANPTERNRMAVNARQQAERTLSWESVVHRALAIISEAEGAA
jgi:glycosyltransferase involved in cell wall biosynthesis